MSSISSTSIIHRPISSISDLVIDGLFLGRSTWLSRTIEAWTHSLFGNATAKLVQTLISAIPYMCMQAFLPLPALILGNVILWVARIIDTKPYEELSFKDVGIGNALVSICKEAVLLATNPFHHPNSYNHITVVIVNIFALHFFGFFRDVEDIGREICTRR
ncbi:MAG: hypothetical protein QRY74_01670 [Chlamydia sp.]